MSVHSISSVDPRLLSAWLKMQLLDPADLASGGPDASAPDFAELLQLLTDQTGNGTSPELPSAGVPLGLPAPASLPPLFGEAAYAAPPTAAGETDALIREAAGRYGVDPALVRAVVRAESGFDPNAESSAGAKGLMQLMDATAAALGVTDPFDPRQNVNGGTRYLSFLLTKYNGSEAVALAAYNAGPGRIDRLGIKTDDDLQREMHRLPKETQAYVGKVLDYKA